MDFTKKILESKLIVLPEGSYQGLVMNVDNITSVYIRNILVESSVPRNTLDKLLGKFAFINTSPLPLEVSSPNIGEAPEYRTLEVSNSPQSITFDIIERRELDKVTLILTMGCITSEEGKEPAPGMLIFSINCEVFEYFYQQIKSGKAFNILNGAHLIARLDHTFTEMEDFTNQLFYGFKPDVVPVRWLSAAA